jgi:hypothetical protein
MSISDWKLCACLFVGCVGGGSAMAQPVQYAVTFDATWSQLTHPSAYPAGAHFSALIGGVHNDQVSFWSPGGLASAGIEQMAEIGGTSLLRGEVQAAIEAGAASEVVQGSGIVSPGSTSISFHVSPEFPLVTLVTMIAPTPDWFVGIHGFDLREGLGWKEQLSVDLFGYDAGTEDGTGFSLSNPETVPRQAIDLLTSPLGGDQPALGTFTFTRIRARDYNGNGNVDAADYTVWRDTGIDGQQGYEDWRSHFGQTAASGAAVVPEPTAWLLITLGIAGSLLRICR